MSNVVDKDPIVLDTFNADVSVKTTQIRIRMIQIIAASGHVACLEDADGNHIAISSGSAILDFSKEGKVFSGLVFDYDDINSGMTTGDYIIVYLA